MKVVQSKEPFRRSDKQEVLKGDECIVLYEKGSGGKVVGVFYSLMEYSDAENIHRAGNTKHTNGYHTLMHVLIGKTKSTFCHHLNTQVVARIKKVSEVNI